MKKTIILSLVLLSVVSQAASERKSINCATQLMTAAKSGIKAKLINTEVKLDSEGLGETTVATEAYEVVTRIQEDSDLKNMYYIQMEIADKVNPSIDPNVANRTFAAGLVVPRKYKYEKESRLALMSSMYPEDNSGGQALFIPTVMKKLYDIDKSYNNTVESVMGLGNGYNEVVQKAVKAGTIKPGDVLGVVFNDACK